MTDRPANHNVKLRQEREGEREMTDQCDNGALGGELSRVKQVADEPVDGAMVGVAAEIVVRHRVFLQSQQHRRHSYLVSASLVVSFTTLLRPSCWHQLDNVQCAMLYCYGCARWVKLTYVSF